jgi:hypothetical protein
MAALVQVEANGLLDSSMAGTAYTAPTTPIKCRLMTANGTGTSAGTEVSGGSYTSQTATFSAASAGSKTTSANLTYTSMPATTVVGVELWDSAGTPIRRWWGALSANKTTNSGDTFSIVSGSLTGTLS